MGNVNYSTAHRAILYCRREGERGKGGSELRKVVEWGVQLHTQGQEIIVLREVYDIYESSYRIMGDNLGGGEQRTTDRHIEI
jgi:hypothetical protein